MKKFILSVTAIFVFGFANAQDTKVSSTSSDSQMAFGIKGGLNLATVTNDDAAKTLTGFNVGAFAEFKITDMFAIQPEVMYSGQGAKYSDGDLKLDYINVPVMFKYYVIPAFSLEAGPQVGFLVSAKADGDDVKNLIESTDFSIDFGAGYNLNENMMLGVRYDLGLTKLQKDLFPGESESKNSVVQFTFGYKF